MSLQSTLLTSTVANVYVSAGNTAVTTVYVSNYHATANAVFTVYAVASGSAQSSTNQIYTNVAVNAGDTYIIDTEKLLLSNNETLRMSTNANSVVSTTIVYTTL